MLNNKNKGMGSKIFIKSTFWPINVFIFWNTTNNIAMFYLKSSALAGFKPGSSASEEVAMSSAPLRHGQ
jgi:hypothetical protein